MILGLTQLIDYLAGVGRKVIKIILHSLFIIYGLWKIWANGIQYPYLVWGDLIRQSYSKVYVIWVYIFSLPMLFVILLFCSFAANIMLVMTENAKVSRRVLLVSIGLFLQSILPPLIALCWNIFYSGIVPTFLSLFKIKVS